MSMLTGEDRELIQDGLVALVGGSVEIYLKHAGPGQWLVQRVAEALELAGYFYSGGSYVLPVPARRWIDGDGWGQLTLAMTDFGEVGDPGLAEDTAFAPYEYELSLDFRGPRQELGRAVFDCLTGLDLPMAYGDDSWIFADFRPGRGVRDFPARTAADERGHDRWYESTLQPDAAAEQPALPTLARVSVFETDGLLRIVARSADGPARWSRPVASTRAGVGARDVGLLVDTLLRAGPRPGADDRESILAGFVETGTHSIEDFARQSVSIEIAVAAGELVAVPHAPRRGTPTDDELSGQVVTELIHRATSGADPTALGTTVLDLIARLRARVVTDQDRPIGGDRVVAALRSQV